MRELEWHTLSDGIIGHEVKVLHQETIPTLNEYGCWESLHYTLTPDNTMYIDRFIDGGFAGYVDVVR